MHRSRSWQAIGSPKGGQSQDDSRLTYEMAKRMHDALEVKDRLWRDLRVYKASFLGTEAVAWLEVSANKLPRMSRCRC